MRVWSTYPLVLPLCTPESAKEFCPTARILQSQRKRLVVSVARERISNSHTMGAACGGRPLVELSKSTNRQKSVACHAHSRSVGLLYHRSVLIYILTRVVFPRPVFGLMLKSCLLPLFFSSPWLHVFSPRLKQTKRVRHKHGRRSTDRLSKTHSQSVVHRTAAAAKCV